jgi:ankyrin repeat protein
MTNRLILGAVILGMSTLPHTQLYAAVESAVADAAMHSDYDTVRSLLREGADVNTAQGDGMTALHWAAVNGQLDTAKMLLYAGANLRATTRLHAYSPLHLASRSGHADTVKLFLDSGANATVTTTTGVTPLMLAASSGSADAVAALIVGRVDVNARETGRGQTALMFAAAYDRTEAIQTLLANAADPEIASDTIDVIEVDKEFRAARTERNKRVEEERKALVEAALKASPDVAATQEETQPEVAPEEKKRNFLLRFFAWVIPGGGNKEPAEEPAGPSRLSYAELVGKQGGLTPLLFASRQGHTASVKALIAGGADINATSADGTTPLLIATINGHFDLAKYLLESGADPTIASEAGGTPLYAVLNVKYAQLADYPQPTSYKQQRIEYLDLMDAFLDAGADINARLTKKVWYSGYNFDLSNVNETGATVFWRAAYASDVEAMQLLVARGADFSLPTQKTPERRRRNQPDEDLSGLPPVPMGGPAVTPLQAAAGVGYGFGFAANSHRYHPAGQLRAVKYLIEDLGVDVNERDHRGYSALHHAAARGDNEMINYLVSKGADVTFVSRNGQTTVDLANGPVQRIEPYPETIDLLVSLGAKNNNKCVSC